MNGRREERREKKTKLAQTLNKQTTQYKYIMRTAQSKTNMNKNGQTKEKADIKDPKNSAVKEMCATSHEHCRIVQILGNTIFPPDLLLWCCSIDGSVASRCLLSHLPSSYAHRSIFTAYRKFRIIRTEKKSNFLNNKHRFWAPVSFIKTIYA